MIFIIKAIVGYNDLSTTNPTLAKEWNYEKNDDLKPDMVMANRQIVVKKYGEDGQKNMIGKQVYLIEIEAENVLFVDMKIEMIQTLCEIYFFSDIIFSETKQ